MLAATLRLFLTTQTMMATRMKKAIVEVITVMMILVIEFADDDELYIVLSITQSSLLDCGRQVAAVWLHTKPLQQSLLELVLALQSAGSGLVKKRKKQGVRVTMLVMEWVKMSVHSPLLNTSGRQRASPGLGVYLTAELLETTTTLMSDVPDIVYLTPMDRFWGTLPAGTAFISLLSEWQQPSYRIGAGLLFTQAYRVQASVVPMRQGYTRRQYRPVDGTLQVNGSVLARNDRQDWEESRQYISLLFSPYRQISRSAVPFHRAAPVILDPALQQTEYTWPGMLRDPLISQLHALVDGQTSSDRKRTKYAYNIINLLCKQLIYRLPFICGPLRWTLIVMGYGQLLV